MTTWTAGYVGDLDYTYGYYSELNPQRMAFSLLLAGQRGVGARSGPIIACELGFGQGMSVNIHAASHADTIWYGTDFNPGMAAFAQELAAASGAEAHLYDQSFEVFCARDDLPDFDIITLHGIWSWINDANRQILVDFLHRKLKPGGLAYISYNCEAGWAGMVPIRSLMQAHAARMAAPGLPTTARVQGALSFTDRVIETSGAFGHMNPAAVQKFRHFKGESPAYVAHEFFNRDWTPFAFTDIADHLAQARLDFACSAYALDQVDGLHLNAEQQALLAEIPDPVFRQTVRDVFCNQAFRRDIWSKGRRPLSTVEQNEGFAELRLMLLSRPADITFKVLGTNGESVLSEAIYRPIIEALAAESFTTLGALARNPLLRAISPHQILQAVTVLIGKSDLGLIRGDAEIAAAKPACDRLNSHFCRLARSRGDLSFLASPVLGGAVRVDRFQLLFMLAQSEGKTTAPEMAQFAATAVRNFGEKLASEGRVIETEAETVALLTPGAVDFVEHTGPRLRQLGVG